MSVKILQMRINTGFYFVVWMLKRFFKTLFSLPLGLHRAYMETYQDNHGVGFLAWAVISSCAIFSLGIVGATLGDTRDEIMSNFTMIVSIGWILSVTYFITCVILDQYEKFDDERKSTWNRLKD